MWVKSESNRSSQRSDAELIRSAQQGSAEAFAALFNSHRTMVYSICLRMTGNTAEADDLTQDVFLQVLRKLDSFRGDSALSTWLYRVTVNTVLMHIGSKELKHISLDEPINGAAGLQSREAGKVDGYLVGSLDRIDLTHAIKELPTGCRTIFVLHEVDGYEHHEIAELLRCSVGNSKSQLHRAKMKIRELL
jgi:RNA polymerase sigma-70 factor (ECF subfamily)